jgi:hypothetical protein
LKKCEVEATKADLTAGIEAAERVLQKANEAVDRDLLDEALEDLVSRVEDWKKHRVDQFGKLLLHGVYTVITGKGDQEKDVGYPIQCLSSFPRAPADLFGFSTRSISLSASCCAARRSYRGKTRTKRISRDQVCPKYATRTQNCNSKAESS